MQCNAINSLIRCLTEKTPYSMMQTQIKCMEKPDPFLCFRITTLLVRNDHP